jgi:hypothetical protein
MSTDRVDKFEQDVKALRLMLEHVDDTNMEILRRVAGRRDELGGRAQMAMDTWESNFPQFHRAALELFDAVLLLKDTCGKLEPVKRAPSKISCPDKGAVEFIASRPDVKPEKKPSSLMDFTSADRL